MNREEALKKIKKCLALAASSNANEAAVAMNQAQRLMQDHNVTMTEMELLEVAQAKSNASNVRTCVWEASLTLMINDIFGTKCISELFFAGAIASHRSFFQKKRRVIFIGVGASAELAGYCHDVLLRQIVKARKAYMSKLSKNCKPSTRIARGDEFAFGFISSLHQKVTALVTTEQHNTLMESYLALHYPELKTIKPNNRAAGQNVKRDDWVIGRIEGAKASLHAGVNGGQAQGLLA